MEDFQVEPKRKVKRKEAVVICHNIVIQQQNNVINYRIEQGYLRGTNEQIKSKMNDVNKIVECGYM